MTVEPAPKITDKPCGNQVIQKTMEFPKVGFLRAKIDSNYIYKCYVPPWMTMKLFEETLSMLV